MLGVPNVSLSSDSSRKRTFSCYSIFLLQHLYQHFRNNLSKKNIFLTFEICVPTQIFPIATHNTHTQYTYTTLNTQYIYTIPLLSHLLKSEIHIYYLFHSSVSSQNATHQQIYSPIFCHQFALEHHFSLLELWHLSMFLFLSPSSFFTR